MSSRLFRQLTVRREEGTNISDIAMPWRPALMRDVDGFEHRIEDSSDDLTRSFAVMHALVMLTWAFSMSRALGYARSVDGGVVRDVYAEFYPDINYHLRHGLGSRGEDSAAERHIRVLASAGLVDANAWSGGSSRFEVVGKSLSRIVRMLEDWQMRSPGVDAAVDLRNEFRRSFEEIWHNFQGPHNGSEESLYRVMRMQLEHIERAAQR
jgi:hypothetical protein